MNPALRALATLPAIVPLAAAAPQLPADVTVFFTEPFFPTPVNLGVVHSSGSCPVTLLTTPEVGSVGRNGMAVDRDGGYLYYTRTNDVLGIDIERIRFNGTGRETLHSFDPGQPYYPQGVALDAASQRLYWVAGSGPTRIGYLDLGGTGMHPLVGHVAAQSSVSPSSIDLDLSAGHLYWWEAGHRRFRRCDLNGTNIQVAYAVPGTGSVTNHRVDTAGGHYYWTIHDELYRAPIAGGPPTLLHVEPDVYDTRTLGLVPESDRILWQHVPDRLRWTSMSSPGSIGESVQIPNVVGMSSLAAMPGPMVVLRIEPEPVPSGGPLEVTLLGAQPGSPFAIFLTSFNGSPTVLPAVSGTVDATGEFSISVPLGTGLSGATAEFVGVALDSAGKPVISLVEAVSFL